MKEQLIGVSTEMDAKNHIKNHIHAQDIAASMICKSYSTHSNGQPSRYTVTETDRGFVVHSPDRPTISVELEGNSFVVRGTFNESRLGYFGVNFDAFCQEENKTFRLCALYKFRALLDLIVVCLMSEWQSHNDLAATVEERFHTWRNARPWAIKQTKGVLKSRIYRQWQRSLSMVNPQVREVHRRMFSICFSTYLGEEIFRGARIESWEELYTRKYLVRDILNYRAAVVAAGRWYFFSELGINTEFTTAPNGQVTVTVPKTVGKFRSSAGVPRCAA